MTRDLLAGLDVFDDEGEVVVLHSHRATLGHGPLLRACQVAAVAEIALASHQVERTGLVPDRHLALGALRNDGGDAGPLCNAQWHAVYANGVVTENVVDLFFAFRLTDEVVPRRREVVDVEHVAGTP